MRSQNESLKMKLSWLTSTIPRFFAAPLSYFQFPSYVQIETTTRCNLHCKMCNRKDEANSDMPFSLFKSCIDQLRNSNSKTREVNLTGLGEPLLTPHLFTMIKYAKDNGLRIGFTSNFTLVNETIADKLIKARLDYLAISFDCASKEAFERMRLGASFEKVIENIKLLVKARRDADSNTPKLMFNSTLSEKKAADIQGLINLAETLGVDGITFYPPVTPNKCYDLSTLQMLEGLTENLYSKNVVVLPFNVKTAFTRCIAPKGCYITFDGKVLLCNSMPQILPRDQYSMFQFGDINSDSLNDVWFQHRYRQYRYSITSGSYPSICKVCPFCMPKKNS